MIIAGRGGGSLEDLWAFNEEAVARAIYDSRIPVVAAVGHEIDYTIADLVADVRAPTPTAAAQIVMPEKAGLIRRIEETAAAMRAAMESVIEDGRTQAAHLQARIRDPRLLLRQARMQLDDAAGELDAAALARVNETRGRMRELAARLRSPLALVREQRLRLSRLTLRLGNAMAVRANPSRMALERYWARLGEASLRATVAARRERLSAIARRLDAVSPLRVMERGYAVVINARDGRAVTDAANVEVGDDLEIRLNRGRLRARTIAREI